MKRLLYIVPFLLMGCDRQPHQDQHQKIVIVYPAPITESESDPIPEPPPEAVPAPVPEPAPVVPTTASEPDPEPTQDDWVATSEDVPEAEPELPTEEPEPETPADSWTDEPDPVVEQDARLILPRFPNPQNRELIQPVIPNIYRRAIYDDLIPLPTTSHAFHLVHPVVPEIPQYNEMTQLARPVLGEGEPNELLYPSCPEGYYFFKDGTFVDCLPSCETAAKLGGFSHYTVYPNAYYHPSGANANIDTCTELNHLDNSWWWGKQGDGWEGHRDWWAFEFYDPYSGKVLKNYETYEVRDFALHDRNSVCCTRGPHSSL